MRILNQKGSIPILLLIAAVGLVAFLIISSSASFKDKILGQLFSKPSSYAASEPISSPITSPSPTATPIPTSIPDTTPPLVSITNPLNGALVSGLVDINARASDNVGIARVEFYVDNNLIGTSVTSPYEAIWDATTQPVDSVHNILAKAFDTSGNSASSSAVTVTIADTIPPSAPTNLHSTSILYNSVGLAWDASTDNKGVSGYAVVRDGVTIAQTTQTSFTDSTVNPNTNYNYQIIAFDAAQNASNPSNLLTVATPDIPDTQAPSAPANLLATAVSSTQINLSWDASTDNIGVTSYDIYRNSSLLTTIAGTSFGDTNLSPSTQYIYYVVAKDAAGNSSSASNTATATTQVEPIVNGSISGTLFSSAGGAIVGAKVSLKVRKSNLTSYTNSQGVYVIDNLPPATYTVTYSANHFISQTQSINVPNGGNIVKDVILQKR